VERAKTGAQKLLLAWDVKSTLQVGFEMIVTGLLVRLESFGINFEFPALSQLKALYKCKIRKFSPDEIYSQHQTSVLHSLEALTGIIDFNRVSHHCSEDFGILGSPSATAAYIINASIRDERAIRYLKRVVNAYGGDGQVPSAFPTSVFELSWALSSLLSDIILPLKLDSDTVSQISSFLKSVIDAQKGLAGFAPTLLSDADDTARTLLTLKRSGQSIDPSCMVQKFEASDYFKTYEKERNPSFSANCNVLLALLELDDANHYAAQIQKVTKFLLDEWASGDMFDKWNTSPQYSRMLMTEALVRTLIKYDAGRLVSLSSNTVLSRIPISLCSILLQTLGTQQRDGSWNSSLEETSYGIVTLSQCLSLPWNTRLKQHLID
jgi:hypothetical protein